METISIVNYALAILSWLFLLIITKELDQNKEISLEDKMLFVICLVILISAMVILIYTKNWEALIRLLCVLFIEGIACKLLTKLKIDICLLKKKVKSGLDLLLIFTILNGFNLFLLKNIF